MKNEKGIALLMALFVAVLLTLLGLSMTFNSINEFSMSFEFENHERALAVADAGFNTLKNTLRGQDLSTKLAAPTVVTRYISYIDPLPGTYGYRNPLFPLEARNVDFSNPPSAYGTRTDKGFLTPASGVILGTGRYFAKLSDNDDETPLGLPVDHEVDSDGTVYMRVMGIQRGGPSERSAYGGSIKNSVAIVEAMIKRDMTFNIGSPFAVYGPNVNPASSNLFDGNSFVIDGFDHSGWANDDITRNHNHPPAEEGQAAIGVIYDNPTGGDASTTLNTVYNGLNPQQQNNLEGADGPWGPTPSLQDDTNDIRNSPYEDAANIFDAYFIAYFLNKISAVADYKYPAGTTLSGSNITLGTDANPKITVAEGDLTISGNGSGAGILVVKGNLNYQGAFNYNGVILVIGTGSAEFGGANKSLIGGIYVAQLLGSDTNADGNNDSYTFGTPSFTLSGNSNFYFKSETIRMGLSLLPLKTIMWREITPEIEPVL